MTYQPTFRYWTISYTYPDGSEVRAGAYADKTIAEINAALNAPLSATVEGVWF